MSCDQPDSVFDDRHKYEPDPDAELERYHSDVDMGFCPFCHVGSAQPAIDVAGHTWTRCQNPNCHAQWEITK